MRLLAVFGGAVLLAAPITLSARTSDDQLAIERGQKSLIWLQNFDCPKIGLPMAIQGLETELQIEQVTNENWTYANGRLAALAEAFRAKQIIESEIAEAGGKASKSMRASFAALDDSIAATSARTASALTQWTLAHWVQISNLEEGIDLMGVSEHPLAPFAARGRDLASLADNFGGALNPIVQKYNMCLQSANSDIVSYNATQIRQAVTLAKRSDELDRVLRLVEIVPASGDAAVLATEIRSKQQAIQIAERDAEERRQAQANAALRFKLRTDAEAGKAVAARYVSAIADGNVVSAANLLDQNVSLISPQGNASGKEAVAGRMRNAANGEQVASMSPPQLDTNYRIFSVIRSNRGSGKMYFIVASGKITQIQLVQD